MHTYIHACIHAYIHTYIHIYIYIYIYICTQIPTPILLIYMEFEHMYTYECMCTYTPVHTHWYKADCVWVGRRRSRPKGKPRFEPLEKCVFRVAQTWLNGSLSSPREFCGQLNQLYMQFKHLYECMCTYTPVHTHWYTWNLSKKRFSKATCICVYIHTYTQMHKHTLHIHAI
jgi:hypothetical protein